MTHSATAHTTGPGRAHMDDKAPEAVGFGSGASRWSTGRPVWRSPTQRRLGESGAILRDARHTMEQDRRRRTLEPRAASSRRLPITSTPQAAPTPTIPVRASRRASRVFGADSVPHHPRDKTPVSKVLTLPGAVASPPPQPPVSPVSPARSIRLPPAVDFGAGAAADSDSDDGVVDTLGVDPHPYDRFTAQAREAYARRVEHSKRRRRVELLVDGKERRDGGVEQEFTVVMGEVVTAKSYAIDGEAVMAVATPLVEGTKLPTGKPKDVELTEGCGAMFKPGVFQLDITAVDSMAKRTLTIISLSRPMTDRTWLVDRALRGTRGHRWMNFDIERRRQRAMLDAVEEELEKLAALGINAGFLIRRNYSLEQLVAERQIAERNNALLKAHRKWNKAERKAGAIPGAVERNVATAKLRTSLAAAQDANAFDPYDTGIVFYVTGERAYTHPYKEDSAVLLVAPGRILYAETILGSAVEMRRAVAKEWRKVNKPGIRITAEHYGMWSFRRMATTPEKDMGAAPERQVAILPAP